MQSTRSEQARTRRVGALALALGLGWAVAFVYAVHGSMPASPFQLPLEERLGVATYLPEGWKFFTRNPQEADVAPYTPRPDGRWETGLGHGEASSVLGLNRASRAHAIEMGMLIQRAPKSAWRPCREAPARCLDTLRSEGSSLAVKNTSPGPVLCGTLGLVSQPPVPWAWAHDKVTMPSQVVLLEVSCS